MSFLIVPSPGGPEPPPGQWHTPNPLRCERCRQLFAEGSDLAAVRVLCHERGWSSLRRRSRAVRVPAHLSLTRTPADDAYQGAKVAIR